VKDAFIPMIFDEYKKFVTSSRDMRDMTEEAKENLLNSRSHFIGSYNYFAGMRLTFKRALYSKTTDPYYQSVLNERKDYYFEPSEEVEDFKEDIKGNLTTYTYAEGQGLRQTGGYEVIMYGHTTFLEALD